MHAITNRNLIVSLLALTAAALLIVALNAASDSGTSSVRAGSSESALAAANDAAASQFSVLEPAVTGSESRVPPAIASVLEELPGPGGNGEGVVTALGVVPGGTASSEVVVAEVSGQICLFAAGEDYQGAAVGSCFSITTAEAGQAYVAVQGVSPGAARVLGIAPDGVENVSVDSGSNGTAEEVTPVQSNVYQADVAKEPTTVAGRAASGEVLYRTEMPLNANGN
jgi:hypothetical protein